jgi:hypothetical protein
MSASVIPGIPGCVIIALEPIMPFPEMAVMLMVMPGMMRPEAAEKKLGQ